MAEFPQHSYSLNSRSVYRHYVESKWSITEKKKNSERSIFQLPEKGGNPFLPLREKLQAIKWENE